MVLNNFDPNTETVPQSLETTYNCNDNGIVIKADPTGTVWVTPKPSGGTTFAKIDSSRNLSYIDTSSYVLTMTLNNQDEPVILVGVMSESGIDLEIQRVNSDDSRDTVRSWTPDTFYYGQTLAQGTTDDTYWINYLIQDVPEIPSLVEIGVSSNVQTHYPVENALRNTLDSIKVDGHDNNVWGITFGGLLRKYDPTNGTTVSYPIPQLLTDPTQAGEKAHSSLLIANNGDVYISGNRLPTILRFSTDDDSPETPEDNPDTDGDNIPDSVENNGPNGGDANNDGIPDSTQANVALLTNVVSGKATVLELGENCSIETANTEAESSLGAPDAGFDYPNALINFTAGCGELGAITTVKLYYYNVTDSNFIVRKYNPNTVGYSTIPGAILSQQTIASHPVTVASYHITDGGELDIDNQQNGTIVDPVGLGVTTVGAPNTGLGALADTGNNLRYTIVVSLALITIGTITLKRHKITYASGK